MFTTEIPFKKDVREALDLLCRLISIPSFSNEESLAADYLEGLLLSKGYKITRVQNNLLVTGKCYDEKKPTLLLNSHLDTVKPCSGWTINPFEPTIHDGKLFGLGANDAGASLVALLSAFFYCDMPESPCNLLFLASAEEEISGKDGLELILPELSGKVNAAIVGEPTQLQLAIAEKGLLVLDCYVKGKSGHAARQEGSNAIGLALRDISWFMNYQFEKESDVLGPVCMQVTMINSGTQHNVVPDHCHFVVDIRVTDAYTHEEILELIRAHVKCKVQPRSMRLRSTLIPEDHPLVQSGKSIGAEVFGSSTLSDKALMPWPTLKVGPGDSARSHTSDEFIYLNELVEGINFYKHLIMHSVWK